MNTETPDTLARLGRLLKLLTRTTSPDSVTTTTKRGRDFEQATLLYRRPHMNDCARCHNRPGTERAYITSRCYIEETKVCRPCAKELRAEAARPMKTWTRSWASSTGAGGAE